MSLTRKHFVALAEILRNAREYRAGRAGSPEHMAGVDHVTLELADYLGRDNPRFNRARFLRAAGVIHAGQ